MLTALQLIKEEFKNAREGFEGTVADVTEEQLHKDPGGKALPLGAVYAHLICCEDVIVQGMLRGVEPLSGTAWKERTGVSIPMPAMDENWTPANSAWAKAVRINLSELRAYSQAVYAATDAYLASLSDTDLEKEVDLGSWGKKTVAYMLYAFLLGHTYCLTGEISALKGIQGAKGYPF